MVRSASVSLSATGPAPRSNMQGMWLRSLALSVCLGQLVLPVHHAHALQTAGSGRRMRLGHLHQRARRQYSQSPAIRMLVRCLKEMSMRERAQFLGFVTSQPRVPLSGLPLSGLNTSRLT